MLDEKNLKDEFGVSSHPSLTCRQICILGKIGLVEIKGIELREALGIEGFRVSQAVFSQSMKRLREAGWVSDRYSKSVVDGHTIREKHYQLTEAGADILRNVRVFVEDLTQDVATAPSAPH